MVAVFPSFEGPVILQAPLRTWSKGLLKAAAVRKALCATYGIKAVRIERLALLSANTNKEKRAC